MDNTPKRFPIAMLKSMKKNGWIDQKEIDEMRAAGLVVEPRKKEVRYIPNTTLIPHFAFKNASTNELTPEAIQLKMEVEKLIIKYTVTKEYQDSVIAEAEKQIAKEEKILADKIEKENKAIAAKVIANEKKKEKADKLLLKKPPTKK